jgi:anti-sigma factor RsiW
MEFSAFPCDTVQTQLDSWLAGRLPEPLRGTFDRHLLDCTECRLDAEAARLVRSVLGRVPRKELLRAIREDMAQEGDRFAGPPMT